MPVKFLLVLLNLLISVQIAYCQSGITFDQLPANYQLFSRDSTGKATVVISGTATTPGPESLSVELWREDKLLSRSSIKLEVSRPGSFSSNFQIRAEKAQYAIRVYTHTGRDSLLVAERTRLVCGDFIQLYGQSNAVAFSPDYALDDTYLRNFTFVAGTDPTQGQVAWYPAKQPYGGSGLIGWHLQELILKQFGIPTCIINGAVGGEGIDFLNYRNPQNPTDLTNAYGQLLYRQQQTKALSSLRAIIWKQGETDAGGAFKTADYYSQQFDKLYKNWQQDYPSKPRIYLSQINFLPDHNPNAGRIRDFQRRTKKIYPNLETIATVGTSGFEGIHYTPNGYLQTANELFRQIARDLYQSTDTVQINSPNIQKVYYNSRKDTVTLVFDDRMQMVWPADSTLNDLNTGEAYRRRMKDFIYLDGQANLVNNGSANQKRVTLALTFPVSATSLTYLPPFFEDSHTTFYNGVHLTNSRGMRAFSFADVPIGNALPVISLRSADLLAGNNVSLSWNAPPTLPDNYEIERADNPNGPFVTIGRTSGQATSFTDTTLTLRAAVVYYRLRAATSTAESPPGAALRVQTADVAPVVESADLQLAMAASTRVPVVGSPFVVTLTLRNTGPATVTQVVAENRLPPNMVFVSGSTAVSNASGVVSATFTSLTVGQAVSLPYVVTVQQPGRYVNAAQVIQSPRPDPDSTPGSGTADGEDDMAVFELRTRPTNDTAVFISPNPNQRSLPPVISNSPPASVVRTDQADLSLAMVSSSLAARLNEVVSFTLTVRNAGGAQAKTITVVDSLPPELELVDAAGWQVNGNQLSIGLTNLNPGESGAVVLRARVVGTKDVVNAAQINRADPADPDSTPGNGTTNGEDDTARVFIRRF
jgi:uncharacterized repeat protein (TIGR01451 family)